MSSLIQGSIALKDSITIQILPTSRIATYVAGAYYDTIRAVSFHSPAWTVHKSTCSKIVHNESAIYLSVETRRQPNGLLLPLRLVEEDHTYTPNQELWPAGKSVVCARMFIVSSILAKIPFLKLTQDGTRISDRKVHGTQGHYLVLEQHIHRENTHRAYIHLTCHKVSNYLSQHIPKPPPMAPTPA
ncbi:hypothetical protein RSOLAG1IB_02124 [Rhizoctonia solani AG-1 IB]|uniref:Uncharacterized protein n=1 Tax=Thanatephorus cucumeris (strain AG1-IB / isolate 7/3/14) TaxID=1108050 RepID=A0A0B7FIA3_THACB|nr:hypothetical protein RSOLAG1IB_02124 [Rhizoctonia solani AG-1 IB]